MKEMIQGLLDERASVWEGAKALLDREVDEKRSLNAEENEQYERMNARIGEIDARLEELVSTHEANAKADSYRERFESIVPKDVRQDAENAEEKALRELISGKRSYVDISFKNVGVRLDPATHGYEVRDLGTYTATAGGNTIPTSFVRSLYDYMVENSAIRQTNVSVIRTASGEALELPTVTGHGAAAVVGEGTALAESDPTFGKLTLNAWKYGQLLQYPHELAADTGVDLLGFLAQDFGRALGNASGAHFITGSGTNQPNGVVTAIKANFGTAVQGASASTPTADNLIDLQYSVIESYARNGYWMMRRATEGAVRKLKDSNNQYLWQPGLQVGTPNLLLGRPIVTDPNMAALGSANMSIIFGDFSGYVIRDVETVRIERSDDFAFSSDLVSWRAILRTDGDLRDVTGGGIHGMDTD